MKNSKVLIARAIVFTPAVLLMLLGLAACGGENGDATTATGAAGGRQEELTDADAGAGNVEPPVRIDACALVTQEEAAAVLGTATAEPVRGDTLTFKSCAYQATEGFDVVNVSLVTYADKAEAEKAHQLAIDINDYPEIEGLGDRAYNAQPIGDVTVLVGRYQLGVDVEGPENDLEAARTLAETAIGRLP